MSTQGSSFFPTGVAWGLEATQKGELLYGYQEKRLLDLKASFAELVAMTLFVIIGCGCAVVNGPGDGEDRIIVAFSFGMAILVLAYAVGHHSGGQMNCAVTLSLVLGGALPWYQGLTNAVAQMLGSLLGAQIIAGMVPCDQDLTTNLGSNIAGKGYTDVQVLLGEFVMTFLLCFVVWETAVSQLSSSGRNTPIAIGFAVFLAHLLLLPVDGCSINPTRSFGPAVVSSLRGCDNYTAGGLRDLWIMWVGPLLGAVAAAILQLVMVPRDSHHPFLQKILGQPIAMPPTIAEKKALQQLEVAKAREILEIEIKQDERLREVMEQKKLLPQGLVQRVGPPTYQRPGAELEPGGHDKAASTSTTPVEAWN